MNIIGYPAFPSYDRDSILFDTVLINNVIWYAASMMPFEYPEDRIYFEKLMLTKDKTSLDDYKTFFDFRPSAIKRAEFNQCRKKILSQLIKQNGENCMLALECCDPNSGIAIDHLIPLSTNKLNKELRYMKPLKGRKVKSQSFGSNHLDNLIIACNKCNSRKKHGFLCRERLQEILSKKM